MSVSTQVNWLNGIGFETEIRGHHQLMDGKKDLIGRDRGPTPKEFVLAGLCGCTAMDVISLMKKFKLNIKDFSVNAQTEQTKEHPNVFIEIQMQFKIYGESIDNTLVEKAVTLSMTKYCGVSAMLSKAVPINYTIFVNDQEIGKGTADFSH